MTRRPGQRSARPVLFCGLCLFGSCLLVESASTATDSGSTLPPTRQESPAPTTDTTAAAPSTLNSPTNTIDKLHGVFLDVMKNATELGFDGRLARLREIVGTTFDLEFMALKVLGPDRKNLVAGESRRWVESFSGLLLSNYARRFVGWSGQSFESIAEEPAPRETIVVRTRLVRPNDEDVKLDYRLRHTPSGWKIIDVYSNGNVSELALRRSEFAAPFKQHGISRLIASVDEQASRR